MKEMFYVGCPIIARRGDTVYWGYIQNMSESSVQVEYLHDLSIGYKTKCFNYCEIDLRD